MSFPKERHSNINEKIHNPLIFCVDQIDVIMNFAVIMNVVIKRVHCIKLLLQLFLNYEKMNTNSS